MSPNKPLDPEATAVIARVRRLMLIASLTTIVAIAAVLAAIGYRVWHSQGSAISSAPPAKPLPAGLPPDAKVLSTTIGEGRIVLTIQADGAIELRSFDLQTLKPLGRVRLGSER